MNNTEITENKYQRGKIYKLISNHTEKVYVGSTCELRLCNRLAGHRKNYKCYQKGKYHYVTSFELVKNDDCEIILLENWPCDSKDQLHQRERFYIDNTLNCVNKYIPCRKRKEWFNENSEKVSENQKQYREKNKEELKYKQKIYNEKNKEVIKNKRKLW